MEEIVDNRLMYDALDRTLEAYGADTARWPDAMRAKLKAFVEANSEAQKRIIQARALDRVLAFAPHFSEAHNAALAGRIVAQATGQPRILKGGMTGAEAMKRQPAAYWFAGRRSQGFAGAALAASLMLGILAGQSADFGTLSDALSNSQQVAQSDDDTVADEDLL